MAPAGAKPAAARADVAELAASDMIPYTVHYDDETVLTKDDGLLQVIRLDGLAFESLNAEQIGGFERRRNAVLRAIASSDRTIYVHLVRRRVDVYPAGQCGTWFAEQFNEAWRAHYRQRAFYANEIYLSIVCDRVRRGAPGWFDRVHEGLSGRRTAVRQDETLALQARQLHEAAALVLQALGDYGARRLCIQRRPQIAGRPVGREAARAAVGRFGLEWQRFLDTHGDLPHYHGDVVLDFLGEDISEIGAFLHYLVNLEAARVPVTDQPLDQALAASWLDFRMVSDAMALHGLHGSRAAAMVSMAEWPARTPSTLLDAFLRQPVEAIITQSFSFSDRISAEHALRQQRRRVTINDHDGEAVQDRDELTRGLEALTRGKIVSGLHHLTMLVHVPFEDSGSDRNARQRRTMERLDAAVGLLKTSFVNLGVKPVREWFALETFYWSQLPGQAQQLIGRRGKIQSANFAGFASLHNFAQGRADGNLWGPAIMALETESGTPYYFNFHREMEGLVAGHTAIAADTGAGKTTLLSALIAMADKARPRVVWFDNREGAKVFLHAMGGRHTVLSVQGHSGWNPFRLADTAVNRAYLVELQMLMRTCYGGITTPDDVERFKRAVDENYALPLPDRRLCNIAWCYGQDQLARDMRIWHGAGANAGVFDNADDGFDLTACRHHGFEMGQLIKDGVARPELPVLLSYPFHCIEQAMNGEPFIVVLEEGQHLVRHAYWREKIDSYLMQIRRKMGLLIFVTPDPTYLYRETDAILKQTATKILLPNAQAQRTDYVDALGLSEAEFAFVRDTPAHQRRLLIRRGSDSVRAVFDLSGLPEFIPVLSSSDRGVALMHAVMAEVGSEDPSQWVPAFMARAMEADTHNLQRAGGDTREAHR